MAALTEDGFDERGECGLGAHFDEGVDTGGEHLLDHADEIDGLCKLTGEQVAGLFRITRIDVARRVGIDRQRAGCELDIRHALRERHLCISDKAAVKGCGDGEFLSTEAALFTGGGGALDLFTRT